jgi:hypothetical protein
MPTLEVTPEMIGADRTRLALSPLENVMLWPHDPEQRKVAAAAAGARFLVDGAPATGSVTLDAADLRDLLMDLTAAQPLEQVEQTAKQPFTRGFVAGLIFLDTLHARSTGGRRNLQQIKSQIAAKLKGKPHFESLAASTVENHVWTIYRPVAHFWGAWVRKGLVALAAGAKPVFPCSVADLPEFLALSEALRSMGERCKLREDRTLLDPKRTWSIPKDLALPEISLTWDDDPLKPSKMG